MITEWGRGDAFSDAHNEVATDKRDLTQSDPIYGVDIGDDHFLKLNPPRVPQRPT